MENDSALILTSKKIIRTSVVMLILSFILGLIFIIAIDKDFMITKTIWGEMTSGVDPDNPGAGELFLLSLFVGGLSIMAEIGMMVIAVLVYIIVPVILNATTLLINVIAKVFQNGENKKWKNITTTVLLVVALLLQLALNLYLLVLSFAGYGLIYVLVYVMFAVNVIGMVMNIARLVKTKSTVY